MNITRPALMSKQKILLFEGNADGNLLTKVFDQNSLKGNYLRIIDMNIFYYTSNAIWLKSLLEDNKLFTVSTAPQYELLRPQTLINPAFFDYMITASFIKFSIDDINLNIFPVGIPPFSSLDLNLIIEHKMLNSIDMRVLWYFYQDPETNVKLHPYLKILLKVETIQNIEKYYKD